MATTAAERKRDERARHRKLGRVAVTVYVQKQFREAVRALEAECQASEPKRKVKEPK
jgi:hypothetical protein